MQMARNLLNQRKIATTSVSQGELLLCDGGGLYLRVRPNAKHWLFIYTDAQGRRKKVAHGTFPDRSLASAREWATEQRKIRESGADPLVEKRRTKEHIRAHSDSTVDALLEAYVSQLRQLQKQSSKDVASIFKLHVSSHVKAMSASSVSHQDLMPLIRKLMDDGKKRTAGKLRSYLHSAFSLAMRAHDDPGVSSSLGDFGITQNPVAMIRTPSGSAGVPGERTLSKAELGAYLNHLALLPESDTRDLLHIQLYTAGQRIAQILKATLERDSDNGLRMNIRDWKGRRSLPRRHEVPLTGNALRITEGRGMKLFGLVGEGEIKKAQLKASGEVSAISDKMIESELSEQPFRLKDIRRTAETLLASLGVSLEVRAQLLSHGISGVQMRHYDRHSYLKEKLDALIIWQKLLEELKRKHKKSIAK